MGSFGGCGVDSLRAAALRVLMVELEVVCEVFVMRFRVLGVLLWRQWYEKHAAGSLWSDMCIASRET